MTIVAIVLARGGSKRLPGKNLRELAGKPLIAHTIEAARNARRLARTIVSTDSADIARVAEQFGAEVPFLRPAELAGDETPSLDALLHAVTWLEANGPPLDAVVLLQPTSPLRQARHIDEGVDLYRTTGVDTVTAISRAADHPYWCWKSDGPEIRPYFSRQHVEMPRNELPPAWVENGALYVIRRSLLAQRTLYGGRIAGYPMDADDGVDIDTLADFQRAERVLRQRAGTGAA